MASDHWWLSLHKNIASYVAIDHANKGDPELPLRIVLDHSANPHNLSPDPGQDCFDMKGEAAAMDMFKVDTCKLDTVTVIDFDYIYHVMMSQWQIQKVEQDGFLLTAWVHLCTV